MKGWPKLKSTRRIETLRERVEELQGALEAAGIINRKVHLTFPPYVTIECAFDFKKELLQQELRQRALIENMGLRIEYVNTHGKPNSYSEIRLVKKHEEGV